MNTICKLTNILFEYKNKIRTDIHDKRTNI